MSGGGIIREKRREDGNTVRYRVVDTKAGRDEYILARAAADETVGRRYDVVECRPDLFWSE